MKNNEAENLIGCCGLYCGLCALLINSIAQSKISLHSVQVSNPCFFTQQFQMLHHECCSPNLQPIHLLGAFDWYLLVKEVKEKLKSEKVNETDMKSKAKILKVIIKELALNAN